MDWNRDFFSDDYGWLKLSIVIGEAMVFKAGYVG